MRDHFSPAGWLRPRPPAAPCAPAPVTPPVAALPSSPLSHSPRARRLLLDGVTAPRRKTATFTKHKLSLYARGMSRREHGLAWAGSGRARGAAHTWTRCCRRGTACVSLAPPTPALPSSRRRLSRTLRRPPSLTPVPQASSASYSNIHHLWAIPWT